MESRQKSVKIVLPIIVLPWRTAHGVCLLLWLLLWSHGFRGGDLIPVPPGAIFAFLVIGESVLIEYDSKVFRSASGCGTNQPEDIWFSFQQPHYEPLKPWAGFRQANATRERKIAFPTKGFEPHLPVEAWLMRCTESRLSIKLPRFPMEFDGLPTFSISTVLDNQFRSSLCHLPKKAIAVHQM